LRAIEKFEQSHLLAVAPLIDAAKIFYVEGYFPTHGTDSVLELSKRGFGEGKGRMNCLDNIQM
jgi:adenosine kinase